MFDANLKYNFYDKYLPYVLSVLLLLGGGILGWWGYNFYVNKLEQSAFKDLAESIESFDKFLALHPEKNSDSNVSEKLDDLERAFVFGSQKHSKSKLVPFFNLYKADTLIQKGDFVAAVEALNSAIDNMEASNPFHYLFLTKRALLKSDYEPLREEGLKELSDLCLNKDNPFGCMAGYYLGLYHYHSGDIKQAKKEWEDTLATHKKSEGNWSDLIRSKLNNIL